MNNLQFYLNKFPSAPDGNTPNMLVIFCIFWEFVFFCECFLSHLAQISTLNRFLKNGKMTTKDWRGFTLTFSGMYCLSVVTCCSCVRSDSKKHLVELLLALIHLFSELEFSFFRC